MKNKKKIVTALAGLALVGAVGGTFAYFTSSATFQNIFDAAEYGVKYLENFVSPDNWLPGDNTPKTLTVKNNSDVSVRVRAKIITEEWKKNDTELNLKNENNEDVAIKHINLSDWKPKKRSYYEEDDGYYYYQKELEPGETTTSFIQSVLFNPETNLTGECTTTGTVGEGTYSVTCTGGEYSGATYTLEIEVETIQANIAEEEGWPEVSGIVGALGNGETTTCVPYTVKNGGKGVAGDTITVNGKDYLILSNTSGVIRAISEESFDPCKIASLSFWESGDIELDRTKIDTTLRDNLNNFATQNGLNPSSVTMPTKSELEGLSKKERIRKHIYWTRTAMSSGYVYYADMSGNIDTLYAINDLPIFPVIIICAQ